jgi:hypothetical protein
MSRVEWYAHAPMMSLVGRSGELLSRVHRGDVRRPALDRLVGGGRSRELAVSISPSSLGIWVSLGPAAGFTESYAMSRIHVHAGARRLGLVVALGLCVLAGMHRSRLTKATRRLIGPHCRWRSPNSSSSPTDACSVPTCIAPLRLPRGAVLDLPVLAPVPLPVQPCSANAHWMPLVVAYSDFIPPDFMDSMTVSPIFQRPRVPEA